MFLKLFTTLRAVFGIFYVCLSSLTAASMVVVWTVITGDHRNCNWFIRIWAKSCCWMVGAKVELKGGENVPEGGLLYVFNHTSWYDIFATTAVLPGFRFGAKIELFKIPIFGLGLKRAGVLPIARSRREEVFRVYQEAEKFIRAGHRYALAPEGTRQLTEKLGQFKSGPFVFAINAKAPIVPVVIKGAAAVMPKDSFLPNLGAWRRTITVEVLPAVDTKGYTVEDRPKLQAVVFEEMNKSFQG